MNKPEKRVFLALGSNLGDRWLYLRDAVAELLSGTVSPPEGLACHSDTIAFGAMRTLRDAGVEVGRDTRVVGFDDVEAAISWSPSLSSISVAGADMGREAARLLLAALDGGPISPRSVVFEPEFRARESCGEHPAPRA